MQELCSLKAYVHSRTLFIKDKLKSWNQILFWDIDERKYLFLRKLGSLIYLRALVSYVFNVLS